VNDTPFLFVGFPGAGRENVHSGSPSPPFFETYAVNRAQPRVITDNHTLFAEYDSLQAGDIFMGRVRLKPGEESILLDLVSRGVQLIPSALSQAVSRSKVLQARLFASFMIPDTLAVHDLHDLTRAVNIYGKRGIIRVVTKHDRRHAGMGVHLWASIEDIYTQASFGGMPFPFVVQPFCPGSRDIRVIMLGDYREAYERHNPYNFRNNLHCGGRSRTCLLTEEQQSLCLEVMRRGQFPSAHVDIMVTEDGASYLAEINLRGGLRGAAIDAREYQTRMDTLLRHRLEVTLSKDCCS
jgi:ribosomal protein S6--L-glutamate ligase